MKEGSECVRVRQGRRRRRRRRRTAAVLSTWGDAWDGIWGYGTRWDGWDGWCGQSGRLSASYMLLFGDNHAGHDGGGLFLAWAGAGDALSVVAPNLLDHSMSYSGSLVQRYCKVRTIGCCCPKSPRPKPPIHPGHPRALVKRNPNISPGWWTRLYTLSAGWKEMRQPCMNNLTMQVIPGLRVSDKTANSPDP